MGLLSIVDNLLKSRLQLVKFNYPPAPGTNVPNTQPMKVFSYDDERTKGSTKYPCYAIDRIEIIQRFEDVRPNHDIFVASALTQELDLPPVYDSEGNALEAPIGPVSYERRPFPTPVDLVYEVHAVASVKLHYDYLIEMLFQALPPGFQIEVTGAFYKQYALFSFLDSLNMDDLEKPEFRRVFLYRVSGLWLERVEHYTVPTITTVDYQEEVSNYGDFV
jgi:hypothetical protein